MQAPEVVTPELLRGWRLPDPAGSKKARGRVVVIGGAAATPGGVALAGLASLRVGTGHVQLAVARSVAPSMAAAFPEAGVLSLPETDDGSISGTAAGELLAELVGDTDAVLIGPGLDNAKEAVDLLVALLPHVAGDAGLVLDAYALGALSQSEEVADALARRDSSAVLTPNRQELRLLTGHDDEPGQDEVPDVAARFRSCVSSLSTVAARTRRTWKIPQGHAGLATAGSGDVLAGLVVGVLGRGADPEQAACWGTYLHATAGERLSSAVGGIGFLARELVDQVPSVLAELS
jgi:ADP-dependent NAD(P)H-hydrate dehydratase